MSERIADAYVFACRADVEAYKPGNVSVYADGHGMHARDFIDSALASAPALSEAGLALGERIYEAVKATRATVGCNTNLGIVLLCAPLAHAALTRTGFASLREGVRDVLRSTDVADAEWVYRAIRLASPAGLGSVAEHDVKRAPRVGLREAMRAAASRDRIAFQYAHDFVDLFSFTLPHYHGYYARWRDMVWAAVGVYVDILASIPDTHVVRKLGAPAADLVSRRMRPVAGALRDAKTPHTLLPRLARMDRWLKSDGINPGTSADLTVATIFAARLDPSVSSEMVHAPAVRCCGGESNVSSHCYVSTHP